MASISNKYQHGYHSDFCSKLIISTMGTITNFVQNHQFWTKPAMGTTVIFVQNGDFGQKPLWFSWLFLFPIDDFRQQSPWVPLKMKQKFGSKFPLFKQRKRGKESKERTRPTNHRRKLLPKPEDRDLLSSLLSSFFLHSANKLPYAVDLLLLGCFRKPFFFKGFTLLAAFPPSFFK